MYSEIVLPAECVLVRLDGQPPIEQPATVVAGIYTADATPIKITLRTVTFFAEFGLPADSIRSLIRHLKFSIQPL